jgi:hypothetical protein
MQAVNILGNDHFDDTQLLQLTQRDMRFVGMNTFHKSAHLDKHFPYLRGICPERIYMSVLRRIVLGPNTISAPEIRYSTFYGYPGARQGNSIPALEKQPGDFVVFFHISPE